MKIIYVANLIVAGWIGISSLFYPRYAAKEVFSASYPETEVMRLVGCLWLTIAVLWALGLFRPYALSPVLLLQFIYKSCWLLFVALPAIRSGAPYPSGMALFFLVWVAVLPFIIPWSYWMNRGV